MYMIVGGVWTDTSWNDVVPGTEEEYGPFESYDEAVRVWRGKMGWKVDTCEHRLFIVQTGIDLGEMDDKQVIAGLSYHLNQINRTIYAKGAPLGSEDYFKIRSLCVDGLRLYGQPIEDVA